MMRQLLLAWMLTSSCAFIVTDGPPSGHEAMTYFECDTNRAPAIIDVISSGLSVALAVAVTDDPTLRQEDREAGALWWAAWAVLHGTSAVWGFNTNGKCSTAKRGLALRAAVQQQRTQAEWREHITIAPASTGCTKDTDCKGDRVCMSGSCKNPE